MAGFLHELGPPASGVYSFVSYPAALTLPNRPKYRNESSAGGSSSSGPVNIMHDRRVVRGNTYSRIPMRNLTVNPTDDELIRQRQLERKSYVKKRVLPNISNRVHLTGNLAGSAGSTSKSSDSEIRANGYLTSEAKFTAARARVRKRLAQFHKNNVKYQSEHPQGPMGNGGGASRKTTNIQTEKWLEEIKDRVPETDVGVQTDEVSISSPPPVPREAFGGGALTPGCDKSTQILPDDPDLFVFDEEVVIVLEALVGKTLEQSLLEVIDEEELAAITQQKLNFENRTLLAAQSS